MDRFSLLVYSTDQIALLQKEDTLRGGKILPDFAAPLAEIFVAEVE